MEIIEIIQQMSDYQKESIKEFYELDKSGISAHGTRAAKPMETLGLIESSIYLPSWSMYKITELGEKVAETLLLNDLEQKEKDLERKIELGNQSQIRQKSLDDFRERLKSYGLL